MMIYEVAAVEDRGSYWSVSGVTEQSFATAETTERYLKLSAVSTKLIKDAILAGHEVRINKPLQFNEVLPNEVKVIKVAQDDIVSIKESAVKRVRLLINPELASVSGLTFYGFICLNNELADKGFFITDQNREKKYLEILETGDEKLIEKLETYLNYKDEIARVSHLNTKFMEFRKKINEEADAAKINKLADDFLDMFYAGF